MAKVDFDSFPAKTPKTRVLMDDENKVWFGCSLIPEPSAMSELAGWIPENSKCALEENPAPKKLTWWQKISGYDKDVDLLNRQVDSFSELAETNKRLFEKSEARRLCAEAMRDHYKEEMASWESIAISKARELELMTKVADNWQQKLICVQKDCSDATEMIGWRLKFSVGHNHIEIIVGNPVTVCKVFNEVNNEYNDAHSVCNQKDQYDWKKGAIQSLTNLMDIWYGKGQIDRSEWFNKLFKKYPELKATK